MATQVIPRGEQPFVPDFAFSADTRSPENVVTSGAAPAIFAGLSKVELTEVFARARMRTFGCDQLLYSQGQAARNLIVLQSGSVKQTQLSSNGDEVLIRISGPGEAVNLHMGLNTSSHTCSARATEDCRGWVWENNRLHELVDRFPRLRANIADLFASRVHELEERFREIATEKVARRLALVLIRLTKQIGKNSEQGTRVSLSREELAQMTGATLFTISRVFSRWAELGLVIPKREAVVIRDATRLETLRDDLI